MKRHRVLACGLLALVMLAGCTTTGMGRGELTAKGRPAEPVLFRWKSADGGLSGTMTASLADATFTGRFFQITRQTTRETLAPMWDGWDEGWRDWPYGLWPYPDTYDATQFVTYYSGKVVANLASGGERRMRCRFRLVDPRSGMAGGGQGECQLSGGGVIQAEF
jgi:hypothetical protein